MWWPAPHDGEHFETVVFLEREDFTCDSLERPALVALTDGGWRLYVSCATPGTKHWRVDVLDADDPAGFVAASARTVLPGDDLTGVKDPVVKLVDGRWHLWLCCHPLDLPEDTDRMSTRYGTSDGRVGVDRARRGTGRDARPVGPSGAPGSPTWSRTEVAGWPTTTDGPASEENAEERTGVAVGSDPGRLVAAPAVRRGLARRGRLPPVRVGGLAPDGGTRLFYETSRRDGAHDLRTEYVPPWR